MAFSYMLETPPLILSSDKKYWQVKLLKQLWVMTVRNHLKQWESCQSFTQPAFATTNQNILQRSNFNQIIKFSRVMLLNVYSYFGFS